MAIPVASMAADGSLHFGAVTVDGALVCLQGVAAPVGSHVLLVDPQIPQTTHDAVVAAASRCPAPIGQGGPASPGVELTWDAAGQIGPLIAVIGPAGRATTHRGQVEVPEAGSARALRFRSCASADGLHLTVWRGPPLRSPRLWQGYVYLNQDLEADCTAAEVR